MKIKKNFDYDKIKFFSLYCFLSLIFHCFKSNFDLSSRNKKNCLKDLRVQTERKHFYLLFYNFLISVSKPFFYLVESKFVKFYCLPEP